MFFHETEISALLASRQVAAQVRQCKAQWGMEHLSDPDFFAIVLLAPAVGLALANDNISLYEEMSLGKKARYFSKGSFFLRKGPVVEGLDRLIREFDALGPGCYALLALVISDMLAQYPAQSLPLADLELDLPDHRSILLSAPYFLTKLLAVVFLTEEEALLQPRSISRADFDRLEHIGSEFGLAGTEVFRAFCQTYHLS
jgi:hypothetical protein